MKRPVRSGPKRRRWRRRDWSGAGGYGQERRWGGTVGNFKREREARRAGLTGKLDKHPGQMPDPTDDSLPSPAPASYGREAHLHSLAEQRDESNERTND